MTKGSPLKRKIGERTYTIERIIPLFKAIQSMYKEYIFQWIEIQVDCIKDMKIVFPEFDFIINKADGVGVRDSSNKAIIFIEISGGPESTDLKHVKEDTEKLLKEAMFGLASLLRDHLDKSAEDVKNLHIFAIQSIGNLFIYYTILVPFEHNK